VKLVLHEDEVPELEVPLAVAAGRAAGPAAAELLAAVVEELAVGAARARPADGPEVVRASEADDALGRKADPLPERDGGLVLVEAKLRVAREDAHPQTVPVDAQVLRDELPRVLDRAFLEVLPEREVAEHLEEGQVVAVETHLVDVLGAEALLRGREERRRGRLLAEEVRHQRLHPGRGQERRAVPARRNQRAGRVTLVPLPLEEGEKAFAELRRRAHESIVGARSRNRAPRARLPRRGPSEP
jgi:hypothetical protein